ncbi:hypothetical protein FOL47_006022 [Perkinsus chesapeaki]|uniref:Uncharacterized protein n=1 Tax=Perkinsus chesapeaki TaxID=330153 RepID=A0A7J6LV62_PERCH|nr:hypothetical protein FOL47_006022 [Perkinsus chesapeaki]
MAQVVLDVNLDTSADCPPLGDDRSSSCSPRVNITVRSESLSSVESVQEELLDVDDDDEMVEAIVYIEPARNSVLLERLQSGRRKTLTNFGPDPSYFFGLHSSATGFFRATRGELRDFIAELTISLNSPRSIRACDDEAAQDLMKECTTRSNSSSFSTAAAAGVQMGDLLLSHDGCVLLSMEYDEILGAVKECASHIRSDTLRFKRCSHMTLAKNREGKGGQEVLGLYQNEMGCDIEELQDKTVWDLIVYEKTFHSDSLEEHGPHDFQEIARIPLGRGIEDK